MNRKSLRWWLGGVSGTSCSHPDGFGGRERYEACDKHHGNAAYEIVKQYLGDRDVREKIADVLTWDDKATGNRVDRIVKAILGEEE